MIIAEIFNTGKDIAASGGFGDGPFRLPRQVPCCSPAIVDNALIN
jgi:hypothetical protein